MIFEACVQTKLLYSLNTIWLKKQELAKVDAFHVTRGASDASLASDTRIVAGSQKPACFSLRGG